MLLGTDNLGTDVWYEEGCESSSKPCCSSRQITYCSSPFTPDCPRQLQIQGQDRGNFRVSRKCSVLRQKFYLPVNLIALFITSVAYSQIFIHNTFLLKALNYHVQFVEFLLPYLQLMFCWRTYVGTDTVL